MSAFAQAPLHAAPGGISHSQSPIVTGSTVLGIKFQGGVMIMADTQGSYGSLAKYKDLTRITKVNATTLLGGGGDYSDFQYINRILQELVTSDYVADDGAHASPREIHSYLGRVMYGRRTKVDPLWNSIVVGGYEAGQPFLGYLDLYGSTYEDNFIATGFGAHMALPIMRKTWRPEITEAEAKALLEECMKILFYRDTRALNRYMLATVSAGGAVISQPYSVDTYWEYKRFVHPDKEGSMGSW